MQTFRSIISRAATVAAAALLLTACKDPASSRGGATQGAAGSAPAAGQPIQLELWHYFTGDHDKTLKELTKKFEEANPGITVKTIFQGNPQQLSQKLTGALAAMPPNNPAVATVYENWTSDYVSKGFLDPVENHFAGPDPFPESDQKDIVAAFREANIVNGKWVTMPFNKSIYLMYYNADMLAEAGYTTTPKTLDELRDAIIKTTKRDGARTATFGLGTMPASEAFTTLLVASGGQLLDEAGKPAFNSPIGEKVLTTLRDLVYPDKYIYIAAEYMSTPLGNRQIAAFIYSSASFPFTEKAVGDKFRWEVAPIPGAEGGKSIMQGTNIALFGNKSDAERAAGWKLIRFLMSTDSCVYWATRSGYMPVRYSMLNHPDLKAYIEKNPRYGVASNLVLTDQGSQEPKIAVWEGIRNELSIMVDRVLQKNADPKAELEEAARKASDRIAGAGAAKTEPADGATTK